MARRSSVAADAQNVTEHGINVCLLRAVFVVLVKIFLSSWSAEHVCNLRVASAGALDHRLVRIGQVHKQKLAARSRGRHFGTTHRTARGNPTGAGSHSCSFLGAACVLPPLVDFLKGGSVDLAGAIMFVGVFLFGVFSHCIVDTEN
jgi:hypothetical protein